MLQNISLVTYSPKTKQLELVRTLGVLLKQGWKPRRTLIIVSFDAEEYGMVKEKRGKKFIQSCH